jgi:hypothetical protein
MAVPNVLALLQVKPGKRFHWEKFKQDLKEFTSIPFCGIRQPTHVRLRPRHFVSVRIRGRL